MSIIISWHAQRQMKWRKISEAEVKSTIADPDMRIIRFLVSGEFTAFALTGVFVNGSAKDGDCFPLFHGCGVMAMTVIRFSSGP